MKQRRKRRSSSAKWKRWKFDFRNPVHRGARQISSSVHYQLICTRVESRVHAPRNHTQTESHSREPEINALRSDYVSRALNCTRKRASIELSILKSVVRTFLEPCEIGRWRIDRLSARFHPILACFSTVKWSFCMSAIRNWHTRSVSCN